VIEIQQFCARYTFYKKRASGEAHFWE